MAAFSPTGLITRVSYRPKRNINNLAAILAGFAAKQPAKSYLKAMETNHLTEKQSRSSTGRILGVGSKFFKIRAAFARAVGFSLLNPSKPSFLCLFVGESNRQLA